MRIVLNSASTTRRLIYWRPSASSRHGSPASRVSLCLTSKAHVYPAQYESIDLGYEDFPVSWNVAYILSWGIRRNRPAGLVGLVDLVLGQVRHKVAAIRAEKNSKTRALRCMPRKATYKIPHTTKSSLGAPIGSECEPPRRTS